MKKLILIAAPLALVAPAAHAQPLHDGGRIFAMIDANGDGQLSKGELERVAERMFKKRDKNNDGYISAADFGY